MHTGLSSGGGSSSPDIIKAIHSIFLILFLMVPVVESRSLCIPGKCDTIQLRPYPQLLWY